MCKECCKYKKAQRVTVKDRKRKNAHKVTNDCDDDIYEQVTHKSQSRKKPKSRPLPVPKKYLTATETILLRIQPPMADREKFINPRHIRCFLEEPEHPSPVAPKRKPCPAKAKSRKRVRENTKEVGSAERKKTDGVKDDKKVEGSEENKKEHPNEEKPKEEQKNEKENSSAQRKKRKKDKFWCPKVNKSKSPKPKEPELDESSVCKDTICSFDSEVYLAGCGLTKEDKETIEKNRQNNSRQSNKTKKSVHEDANTKKTLSENKKKKDSTENPAN